MPRKFLSDAELALLPGYRADPKGRGHYFDSPTGRCFLLGAMPGDECHGHDRWGMINISKVEDAILREKGRPQCVPIDAGLKQNFDAYEFDQALVDSMTIDRRDQPIIMVMGGDGAHVIDGTHRLRRRVQDGCTDVEMFLMNSGILRAMRVRLWRQQADGRWKQVGGVSDEDLDREIEGGRAMAKKIVRPRE